jgi:hypothetical protein
MPTTRFTTPVDHPRSRSRLNRAIKEYVGAFRAQTEADPRGFPLSEEEFVLAIVRHLVDRHSRDRLPEPEPKFSPLNMVYRSAELELQQAVRDRAQVVAGFDEDESESIVDTARKAIEAR